MKNHWTLHRRYVVLLLSILTASWLGWGILPTQSRAFASGIMIMEGKTAQGFPYMAGGVSSEEREKMEELAKGYNVKLQFAERRGPYLSDVEVMIQDAKGAEVVSVTTNGPWFYIQLPPGNYTIAATFQRETRRIKNLGVPKDKRVSRTLTWDLGDQSKVVPQR